MSLRRSNVPFLFAVLAAVSVAAAASSQSGLAADGPQPAWETKLAQGLERARKEGRLVVVDFWRDNCLYCVRMDQETFVDPGVAKALKECVAVKAKNTDHAAEIEKYGVTGYPTIALLDADGKAVDVHVGFMGASEFVSWVTASSEQYRRSIGLKARLAKDPGDVEALLTLGRQLAGEGKREEARECFAAIIRLDPQGKRADTAEAHLEIGLTWRRGREYPRAVESLGRAREIALALAFPAPAPPPEKSALPTKTAVADKSAPVEKSAPAAKAAPADKAASPAANDLLDRALYELAVSYLLGGGREGLRKTLEEYDARVLKPDERRHAWVLLQLGELHRKTGASDPARRAFRRCDELYPRSSEARQCREALASLK